MCLLGTIPVGIVLLSRLSSLYLGYSKSTYYYYSGFYGNKLTGVIPPSIGALTNLIVLDFS